MLVGNGGGDIFDGGSGNDTADYSTIGPDLNISLDGVANDGSAGENDNVLPNIEIINSGSGNDTINASAAPGGVTINGNNGNDSITGGANNDSISGGAGNDTIDGGLGG